MQTKQISDPAARKRGIAKITSNEYSNLDKMYEFLNKTFFGTKLPDCLMTMQRKAHSSGYYSYKKFKNRTAGDIYTDEIALNPDIFEAYSDIQIISILAHEMCHLWQFHYGTPGRTGYHNKEWSSKMESIGLMPSDTEKPGGKKTGQNMSDYIIPGGRFEVILIPLMQHESFKINWQSDTRQGQLKSILDLLDNQSNEDDSQETKEKQEEAQKLLKKKNKLKYTCPSCKLNAWGKPGIILICGKCDTELVCQD